MGVAALMFLLSGVYGLFVLLRHGGGDARAYILPVVDILLAGGMAFLLFFITDLHTLVELALMAAVFLYLYGRSRH
jgi:hypothetical protein